MTQILAICLMFAIPLAILDAKDGGKISTKDTGKEKVGSISATLYIGTDADVSKLEKITKKTGPVDDATIKQLQSIQKMRFTHYRQLGKDIQSVFRSYENWLSPLKPSEEILLSFESRGRSSDGGLRLDLEFWQHRRKVMKSDPVLHLQQPLFILGPKWRGGTLIIAVELLELTPQK